MRDARLRRGLLRRRARDDRRPDRRRHRRAHRRPPLVRPPRGLHLLVPALPRVPPRRHHGGARSSTRCSRRSAPTTARVRRDVERGRRHRPDRAAARCTSPTCGRAARRQPASTVKFCSGMGPANLAGWLTDEHYHDKKALYRDLADAYNAEFKDAVAAGRRGAPARRRRLHAARARRLPARPRDAQPRARGRRRLHDLPHLPPRQRRPGRHHAVRRLPRDGRERAATSTRSSTPSPRPASATRLRAVEALPERQGPRASAASTSRSSSSSSRRTRSSPPCARRSSTSSPSACT